MKKLILISSLLIAANLAFAESKAELDAFIRRLGSKFERMQADPTKAVPAEELRKARGVVLMERVKAGFLFAYQGGGGVALVKDGNSENFGAAAFLQAGEGSIGFQVGGEKAFYVILLMSTNSARAMTDSDLNVKSDARATAGDKSAGAESKITPDERPIRLYTDRAGLYAGAALKAGAITPDDDANKAYYGQAITVHDILFHKKVQPTEAAKELAKKLTEASKVAKK